MWKNSTKKVTGTLAAIPIVRYYTLLQTVPFTQPSSFEALPITKGVSEANESKGN